MARLSGPDFISLQVRNLSVSRTFYTEMLGFTTDPRFDAPDFVLFDTNSIPRYVGARDAERIEDSGQSLQEFLESSGTTPRC